MSPPLARSGHMPEPHFGKAVCGVPELLQPTWDPGGGGVRRWAEKESPPSE